MKIEIKGRVINGFDPKKGADGKDKMGKYGILVELGGGEMTELELWTRVPHKVGENMSCLAEVRNPRENLYLKEKA